MTIAVFEVAALADAISKAARVAPTTGAAFDRAAGIVIDIDPSSAAPCVIRATNMDLFSMEWVDTISAEGDKASWRISSKLLAAVVGSLPIGSGKEVTLESVKSGHQEIVTCKAGRMQARFNLMDMSSYPQWGAFNPDKLVSTVDMGGRLTQVEWSTAASELPFCGVHMNGERIFATDRYVLTTAPLVIPELYDPITIPAGVLSTLLKQTGEIRLGVEGSQLLIMPDEHSQYRAILFGINYPSLNRIMEEEKPLSVTIRKTPFLEVLRRAEGFAGSNRYPLLQVKIGKEEIAVIMNNDETGLLGDIYEVPGEALHKRVEIKFTPKNLIGAIENAPNEEITLRYDPDALSSSMIVDGGSGYISWVMPRRDVPPPMASS